MHIRQISKGLHEGALCWVVAGRCVSGLLHLCGGDGEAEHANLGVGLIV